VPLDKGKAAQPAMAAFGIATTAGATTSPLHSMMVIPGLLNIQGIDDLRS
jgi:hypothetical protein